MNARNGCYFLSLAAFVMASWTIWRQGAESTNFSSADDAVDQVCSTLIASAREKGLTGPAREIDRVNGPSADPYFDSLAPFINGRLANGFASLVPPEQVQKVAVEEVARQMDTATWTKTPPPAPQVSPQVLLLADWGWTIPEKEAWLRLRAVRVGLAAEGTQASVRLHPHGNPLSFGLVGCRRLDRPAEGKRHGLG